MDKPKNLNWKKVNGLMPVIIQDAQSRQVLMLGYMTEEALQKTLEDKKVTFFSRTKKRLWQKGETSGNFLFVKSISEDCDNDALLIQANPVGPTCHTGNVSCFTKEGKKEEGDYIEFLIELYRLIQERKIKMPEGSYTTSLFEDGLDKIAQKVGEEAVEVVIAAKNDSKQLLVEESSDLLYHFLTLLVKKEVSLDEIVEELKKRHSGN